MGKFCASAGVGLFLQESGPTQITVRRHAHARVLAGLEPDYKPARAKPLLWHPASVALAERRMFACSANSSAPLTWSKLHRKSLAELWIEGGDGVPRKGRRKPQIAWIPLSPPNPEATGLFGNRVILHLTKSGSSSVPFKMDLSKVPCKQQIVSVIN